MLSKSLLTRIVVACLFAVVGANTAHAYYAPQSGRFISRDPMTYPDGANTYAAWYVPDDTDPTGMIVCGVYTPPIGKPSGSFCDWLTWLGATHGKCCTSNQIAAGEACCKTKGQRLSTCTNYDNQCKVTHVNLITCRDETAEECEEGCWADFYADIVPCKRLRKEPQAVCVKSAANKRNRCLSSCPPRN